MASKKPITQSSGILEQLQSVDTLTVGDYDLPNAISDDGKVLVTVNAAAVWEFYSHADLTNLTVDDHHDQSHTHNGTDDSGVVEHDDTANITVDDHHDQSHTHNGADSSGVVEHDDTANITVDDHHDQSHTHNGADSSGVVEHDDTANITVDNHHDQSHTHNGTDDSGVVEHSDTANIAVDDHHDQSHSHNGADDSGTVRHSDTTNIAVDDHHNKVHTHNGADGSGVVEHDDTANGTIANHDTAATGTELDTLTDGSNADALHVHSAAATSGNTTYYLATTGSDSTGNGTSANPWKSVSHAVTEIYSQSWGLTDVATITIADGTYEFRETLIKNGSASIAIVSTNVALTGNTVSVVSSSASGGGWYSVRLDIASTTGFSTGQLISFQGISGTRSYLNGAWVITAINDATDLTISLWSRTKVPAAGANIQSFTTARVVFHCVDDIMFVIKASDVSFSGISFVNNSGTGTIALDVQGSHRINIDSECSFNGYLTAAVQLSDSALTFDNVYFAACANGIALRDLSSGKGGVMTVAGAVDGVICYGSMFWAETSTFSSCSNRGVNANQYSYVTTLFPIYTDNLIGMRLNTVSAGIVTSATYSSNGTNLSPAANTEGNRNSYMQSS